MENKVTLTMKAQHTLKMEMDCAGGSGMVGVPPIVVSRILGHSKPSDTLDIYGHLYHEMQGEAARIRDDLVTPIRVKLHQEKQSAPR